LKSVMSSEVKVPALGESIAEATLGQWLKKPGDAVAADEPIASLETDKVAIEVNAPIAGVMGRQFVAEGDTVLVGAVIAAIEASGAGATPAAAPLETVSAPVETAEAAGDLTLSPSVRRLVLERGIDPSKIKGTGKDGRLTKEDVLAAPNTPVAPTPVAAAAAAPPAAAGTAAQNRCASFEGSTGNRSAPHHFQRC
jgi:2-oxoglutarate dehydrogenase E2 component (dihydrolipoamide succinyltransferase)